MKISRKTLLAKIVETNQKAAEVLVFKYGFHCVGCAAAAMETLEDGARVHGMSEEEIDKLVERLNRPDKNKKTEPQGLKKKKSR